jgi:transposase
MFVARVPNRNSPPCYLLRENHRVDGKVKTTTLANLSSLSQNQIDAISAALKNEDLAPVSSLFRIDRSLPHGHVAAIIGTLRKIGLDRLISPTESLNRSLVLGMIALRIMAPDSKLAMSRMLSAETATSSLSQVLGIGTVSANDLYRAMDWLGPMQNRIEKELATRHLVDGSLVLYDITSVYFEGTHCELAKYGHNRDGKTGTSRGYASQIVVGLICTGEGCPISVEVFEGNTADPSTVADQIEKVKARFGIHNVILVGDRGMITGKLIEAQAKDGGTLSYVTALRSQAIKQLVESGLIDRELFDQDNMAEISSPDFPGERLVVCMNPYLREERGRKRDELLESAKKKLTQLDAAVKREKRPLRGKDAIGMKVGGIFARNPMKKHFKLEIGESTFSWAVKNDSVEEERKLDGLYIIRTNVDKSRLADSDAVRTYKRLAKVERAFRCMKLSDLEIRPVFHWRSDRVRSHVFLCMLSYYVEWHLRKALAPILFEEHDEKGERALHGDPVAPAPGSTAKARKVARKRTDDDLPVHSFQSLLKDLATLTLNTVTTAKDATFTMLTRPTKLQARAFDLLDLGAKELSVGRTP